MFKQVMIIDDRRVIVRKYSLITAHIYSFDLTDGIGKYQRSQSKGRW
jgi:hypothetical protein